MYSLLNLTQKEEIYAIQFYQELKNEFWGKQHPVFKFLGLTSNRSKTDIRITLKKAGTQSICTIVKELRQCSINCFNIDMKDVNYKGPEYYTTFTLKGKSVANGRTFDKRQTIDAIKNWIENKTLEELYSKFTFIDQEKRLLEELRADINSINTELLTISRNEVSEEIFSSYSLWFKQSNRSCRVYSYGYETNPRYIFHWDNAIIFEISGSDIKRLGSLIKKWVFDMEMPSTLKIEFPEIVFGKLAEYYEKGNGIEGEFILSWDNIETFYDEFEMDRKDEVLRFIKQMRDNGFDRTLRAGQSLYTLILSRSRRHGLREDQASILFSFQFIKSAMEVLTPNGEKIEFDKIEYNATIEKLLRTIELEIID